VGCDYDLVIVGATTAGVAAAQEALSLGARVALISQGEWLAENHLFLETLALQQRLSDNRPVSEALPQEILALLGRRQQLPSPSDLLRQGVDVVEGVGQLLRPRDLSITLPHRQLKGRRLLLTPGVQHRLPDIPGLALVTPLSQPRELLKQLGDRLVLIGQTALSLAWAQIAQRLGYRTTLVVPSSDWLDSLETTLANRLLAELAAEAIRVQVGGVLKIQRDQGEVRVYCQDRYWPADQLLVEPRLSPGLNALPLDLLQEHEPCLVINNSLQTRHRRVFACEPGLPPTAAAAAGRVAARNALLWGKRRFHPERFPSLLPTDPPLSRVGLSFSQARRRWGDRLEIRQIAFQDNLQAQIAQKTGGICQLICSPQGRLLGAQVIGSNAVELITPLSVLVQQQLSITALIGSSVWPSLSLTLQAAAQAWALEHPQSAGWRWWREERFIFWRSL
jgi:pyruvate/2-oxoglutarate dehydrogenase complex dihydrolipoamide dehydrogenase (E3) component